MELWKDDRKYRATLAISCLKFRVCGQVVLHPRQACNQFRPPQEELETLQNVLHTQSRSLTFNENPTLQNGQMYNLLRVSTSR